MYHGAFDDLPYQGERSRSRMTPPRGSGRWPTACCVTPASRRRGSSRTRRRGSRWTRSRSCIARAPPESRLCATGARGPTSDDSSPPRQQAAIARLNTEAPTHPTARRLPIRPLGLEAALDVTESCVCGRGASDLGDRDVTCARGPLGRSSLSFGRSISPQQSIAEQWLRSQWPHPGLASPTVRYVRARRPRRRSQPALDLAAQDRIADEVVVRAGPEL